MVVAGIKRLIRGHGSARGMVSLPTGAGKTRVAVQALIEEIRDGALTGPVVWIAQTNELCEQAVETWSYIWRATGPAIRMTVSRLWSTNDADEVTDGFHLVVATVDKLNTLIGDSRYEWLTDPTVVVVDEAHSSIAPIVHACARLARTRSLAQGAAPADRLECHAVPRNERRGDGTPGRAGTTEPSRSGRLHR